MRAASSPNAGPDTWLQENVRALWGIGHDENSALPVISNGVLLNVLIVDGVKENEGAGSLFLKTVRDAGALCEPRKSVATTDIT